MLRWILVGLAVLVLLVGSLLAAVPYLVDLPAVQAYLTQAATQALGRPIRYRSLAVSVLPLPSVVLRGLEVSEDPRFGSGPALTVEDGRLRMRLRPLLSGRVELTSLTITGLRLQIIEDSDGRLNVATLFAEPTDHPGSPRPASREPAVPPAAAVLLGGSRVTDGTIRYQRLGRRPITLTLERLRLAAIPRGRPDEFDLTGEAQTNPGGLKLALREARLGPVGTRPLAEAPFRATLEIDAPDVASLATLVTASPGLSGPLKGKLLLEGSLSRLAAAGDLQLERLVVSEHRSQCPPPPRRTLEFRDVTLPVRYSPAALEGAPVRARLAGGTVSARVEMRLDPSPVVSLRDLGLRGVQLEPVLGRYLCAGYAVSGPLDLTGEARMRIDDPLPTMTGAGRFQIGPGKVVGGEALAAISDVVRLADTTALPSELARLVTARTPPSFESITATYRIVDGVARTDDLLYRSHGFTVSAAGSYGLADRRLEMNVTFTQGGNHVRALVTASPTGRLRIVPTGLQPADSGGVRRFIDRLMR